ncbi:TrmH family RNA methyltransferase [Haloglycomyces albus]|uniref:TrmH family RNA methyltransferase n=1 Tax=Haloglycomyces albus TaxID=526067 RepID=UPI00046CF515|nr:RNA methyltransferase [Haloglycomyces albus]
MSDSSPGTEAFTIRSSRVSAARKLTRRRARDQAGRFLVEGPQAIGEALRADAVVELFYTERALERWSSLIVSAPRSALVTEEALQALAETMTPQGVVAVCRFLDQTLPVEPQLVVVLDGIADPGNAGTVLRAADAAGADAVVFGTDSVDPYNGKCVRSSTGSIFHLPVVRGKATEDVLDAFDAQVLAAAADGDDLFDLRDAGDLDVPTVWLFGSEPHGLDSTTMALAHRRVGVPIWGNAESLNLGVAAGVCLYTSAAAQRSS